MKQTDVINPTAIKYPVAVNGLKNNIPLNATGTQKASITGGFPAITMTPIADGGKAPEGKDFNGLFYLATDYKAFLQDGGYITFSQTVSDLIGGYPKGAILDYYTSGTNSYTKVVSLIDDNTYNFVTTPSYIDGAKWQFVDFGGANKALSNLSADGNDFINQSKAMITGLPSDNATVYADILSRYRSSFDITNFTVVGSPTINKGIVSVFSPNNYITFPLVQLGNYSNWEIDIEFATSGTITGLQRIFTLAKNVYYNGVSVVISSGTLYVNVASNTANATNDIVAYSTTAEANKKYQITIKNTGTAYVGTVNGAEVFNETSSAVCGSDLNFATIGQAASNYFIGSVDLTKFAIYGNGDVLVSGMNRGSDTYTVDGNTVTIPYIITNGGAKIADMSAYLDVKNVYDNGFTDEQYLCIDEENEQFALPQGMSVYEGIGKKANKSLSNINADGINDIFVYNQPADTYTTLTLGASGSTYTATDNGFFYLRAVGSSFRMYDATTGYGVEPSSTAASIYVTGVLPVRKGQVITIDYTIMDAGNVFRFFKARGV